MSNEKFTPGPWCFENGEIVTVKRDENFSSSPESIVCYDVQVDNPADVNLMCAAPKMYNSLLCLLELAENEGWSGCIVESAKSALKQARGE